MAKKQTTIPGTEPQSFPTIDQAVSGWREVVDERVRLSDKERVLKDAVFEAMRALRDQLPTDKDGFPTYRYVDGDTEYIFVLKDRLVFKKAKVVPAPLEEE